jgi:hypothetical protein
MLYDFLITFAENFGKYVCGFFAQATASFSKNLRKTPILSPKIGKNRRK